MRKIIELLRGSRGIEPEVKAEFKKYETDLDRFMAFSSDQEKIKMEISMYNFRIQEALMAGEVLPYSIAKNFNFLPKEIICSIKHVEWFLNRDIELTWLMEFLDVIESYDYHVENWHLSVGENFWRTFLHLCSGEVELSYDFTEPMVCQLERSEESFVCNFSKEI
jgi:hypothetical protein